MRTPNRIATVTREPKDKLPPPNHDLTDQTKLDADAELTPMPGRPPRPPDRGNSPTRLRFQRFDEGALQLGTNSSRLTMHCASFTQSQRRKCGPSSS